MLDIKLIRENPEAVRKDLKKRGDSEKLSWLEELIEKDKQWRGLVVETDKLKAERNKLSEEIGKMKKSGKDAGTLLKQAAEIPEKIKENDKRISELSERTNWILMRLPNILHESVPVGKDDSENVELRKWGKIPKFKFTPKDHQDLLLPLGLMDVERAAKTSGARFYFLRGDLVRMNYALMNYALDFLKKKGFTAIQPPYLINRKSYEGVVDFRDFESVIYKIEGEDLHMIATSEHPLVSMHAEETFLKKDLPEFYAGISPCFRKEAGAHGKDTKGIFRVHQFDKVEQICFCSPEESWKLHEQLIKNAEEFYKTLETPFRVVNICTGDIGTIAAKKYDLEGWFPAQEKYRELVSCSNTTDYQARRLGIKFREKEGAPPAGFAHILNSTLVATGRTLACIAENFQRADGTIEVPKVLQKYMNGQKIIGGK